MLQRHWPGLFSPATGVPSAVAATTTALSLLTVIVASLSLGRLDSLARISASFNKPLPVSPRHSPCVSHESRHQQPMNPTTMEHDYRFPRRPDGRQLGDHDRRTLDVSMLDKTIAAAGRRLLSTPLFPPFDDANAAEEKSLGQMQQEDPLAMQVWRFFSRTKQQLPNQDRMENLTWRMMAVEIRKQRAAARLQQVNRYAALLCLPLNAIDHGSLAVLVFLSLSLSLVSIMTPVEGGVDAHPVPCQLRHSEKKVLPHMFAAPFADQPTSVRQIRATTNAEHPEWHRSAAKII